MSFTLNLLRKEARQRAMESSNKFLSTLKAAAKGAIGGVVDTLKDGGRFLQNSLTGRRREKEGLQEECAEFQTSNLSRNPIIASLITITNHL